MDLFQYKAATKGKWTTLIQFGSPLLGTVNIKYIKWNIFWKKETRKTYTKTQRANDYQQSNYEGVYIMVSRTAFQHLHSALKCFTIAINLPIHSHTIVHQWVAAAIQGTASPNGRVCCLDQGHNNRLGWRGVGASNLSVMNKPLRKVDKNEKKAFAFILSASCGGKKKILSLSETPIMAVVHVCLPAATLR